MKNDVRDLINQQINREFHSAYLYLDFACYFEKNGLKGFAHWFREQAKEELKHGMLFIRYLIDSGEMFKWQDIEQPVWPMNEQKSCLAILKAAYRHEQYITGLIEIIYAHAEENQDLRTLDFLDWFIAEQTEEEKTAADLIREFELFGENASSLYLLDCKLGKREDEEPDPTE